MASSAEGGISRSDSFSAAKAMALFLQSLTFYIFSLNLSTLDCFMKCFRADLLFWSFAVASDTASTPAGSSSLSLSFELSFRILLFFSMVTRSYLAS